MQLGKTPSAAGVHSVAAAAAAVTVATGLVYEPEEGERCLSLTVSSDKQFVILSSSLDVSSEARALCSSSSSSRCCYRAAEGQ